MRLEGKVALVTGGARGMGAVEAKLLAREGAKVIIADVLEEEGRQVEAEIGKAGGEAMFVRLDVTNENEWGAAVEQAVARFGKLNVLVNNAGIAAALTRMAPARKGGSGSWPLTPGVYSWGRGPSSRRCRKQAAAP